MNSFDFLKSPNEVNKDIEKRIKDRIKERKLSQVELSTKSNVSLGSIKRFETKGEISLSSLIKIAFALGCEDDFDNLFSKNNTHSLRR